MDFTTTLQTAPLILTEAAISERLRRRPDITLHPTLFFTPLIHDTKGREAISEIYSQYIKIAQKAGLPLLLCAPTWRVDKERTTSAGFDQSLVGDAVTFMLELRKQRQQDSSPLFIGGLLGPKNDCYRPDQALSSGEAKAFHQWQVKKLHESGVEVIVAQTIPAVSEAQGIALSCKEAGVPHIISFVINRHGQVLDQTPLDKAIEIVDEATGKSPVGYMVNCVHPSFLRPWFSHRQLFQRLIGIQANSSSLDHSELEGSVELKQDDFQQWGEQMVELNRNYGIKILGGCCGTDDSYLEYVAKRG